MVALPAGLDRAMLAGLALRATTRRKAVAVDLFAGAGALTLQDLSTQYQMNQAKILDLLGTLVAFLVDYTKRFDATPTPSAIVKMRVDAAIGAMSPKEIIVLEQRVLADKPRPHRHVAAMCGFSPARSRVVEQKVRQRIEVALGEITDVGCEAAS